MGIRFDKDIRRATNGPIIFFSDPSSESAFAEEIRCAIISGLSFYSYRQPGDLMISFGSSEGYIDGLGIPGFVVGRFNPQLPFITIPYKGIKSNSGIDEVYMMPYVSTTEKEYCEEVEEIQSVLQHDNDRKIVAARVLVRDSELDIASTFFDFCRKFPNDYIFCFSTPVTGCWIGASPELLLEGNSGQLRTMALAGTRQIDSKEPWDEKNIEEQNIVTDYICEKFIDSGLDPHMGERFSKVTGKIEHLCTPINSDTGAMQPFILESLLKSLSPTPALCGNPKELALETISRIENFDRGCYGGFCGPYHSSEDFSFNVVLRCASVSEQRYCIYAGGGITIKSNPRDEWLETEIKIHNSWG